ncbi:MAG: TetR/AcrR family transcriptional regulator [Acidobacteria bacterium]|nr:TetR/AcrR family transcriptional regulator [Acidobacteriota bacterium]
MAEGNRPYHHANLKDTLLDAAIALIAEVGPNAFTLREVARRAGVSHNAPYRHFRDREDLLGAVAAQGFHRLTASLEGAMGQGATAVERLRLAGHGYMQFALEWPQHIQVMFDLPHSAATPVEYIAAGERAFQTLLDAVIAVQGEGALPPGDPHPYAVVAWSSVHGLAKLAIAQRLPFTSAQALDFTAYLTAVVSQGMRTVGAPQTLS